MTPLRQRMLEDMQLRGFSPRTQEAYVGAVRQLAAHFRKPPDQLTEDDLRQYFLYLANVKHFARASFTIALCGIKFFYERTLGRDWQVLDLVRPAREKKLPAILSRDEVRRILSCVRLPVYRACLTTIYVCGLRLLEGARVQVADVDSARGLLHVHGKGGRDRYVPLPSEALGMLREHWRTHRSPAWLFPAPVREGTRYFVPPGAGPISRSSLQSAFGRARKQSGVAKRAHVHTLRHSYATHLLEDGVNLRLIQVYLGRPRPHQRPDHAGLYPSDPGGSPDRRRSNQSLDAGPRAARPPMLEPADIVRATGEVYQRLHASTLLPSQRRALHDIAACRTAVLGGHVRACDHCGTRQYSYHSCRNRHCPKCHGEQTRRWLDRQRARLLPCAYFLLTFTLPAELRALARAHQKVVYGLLMTAAAAALLKLSADPRYLGARPGVLAVLHTWTRALLYHPHVHMLVTAGGLRGTDRRWVASKRAAFLVPGRVLSRLFRAKVRRGLRKAGLLDQVPLAVWRHEWVVHVQHAGTGEKVLDYLARYVFRIALVNSRLERFEDGQVTFRYRDGRTGTIARCTLDAVSFLGRFLQHVLPRGFSKVRHYGLFSPSRHDLLAQAREQLLAVSDDPAPPVPVPSDPAPGLVPEISPHLRCPACGIGVLHLVEILLPCERSP